MPDHRQTPTLGEHSTTASPSTNGGVSLSMLVSNDADESAREQFQEFFTHEWAVLTGVSTANFHHLTEFLAHGLTEHVPMPSTGSEMLEQMNASYWEDIIAKCTEHNGGSPPPLAGRELLKVEKEHGFYCYDQLGNRTCYDFFAVSSAAGGKVPLQLEVGEHVALLGMMCGAHSDPRSS